ANPSKGHAGDPNDRRGTGSLDAGTLGRGQGIATAITRRCAQGRDARSGQGRSSSGMNFVERHPFVDPDAAARKLIEIAKDVEAVQDGRIFIEPVNEPFLAGRKWRAV